MKVVNEINAEIDSRASVHATKDSFDALASSLSTGYLNFYLEFAAIFVASFAVAGFLCLIRCRRFYIIH